MKVTFKERQRNWRRFEKWEARRKKSKDMKKTLQLIGEWVDFFLSRHPKRSNRPNVQGIQEMHRSLSHIDPAK